MIPTPVFEFFRRAGIVEHLFGERDPLLVGPGDVVPARHDTPVVTVIDKCGQATKGVWWMSWHREAMKDVVACDKLREAGKRALIRRFPNRETGPV